MLVNFTKPNKEIKYIKINLIYIRAYFKQVKELNLITKREMLIIINLKTKIKTLTTIKILAKTKIATNLLTKTKTTTNLLLIANKY